MNKINKIKVGEVTYGIDNGFEDSYITINGNDINFIANSAGGYNAEYTANLIEKIEFEDDGDYRCTVATNSNDETVATISGAKRIALNDRMISPETITVGTSDYSGVYKINISGDSNYINVTEGSTAGEISVALASIPSASSLSLGGIKAESHSGSVSYNTVSNTENRYYSVEVDSNGKAFVNVPWVASQSGNGTITEIQMNGAPIVDTNGVVNLGTVVTEDNTVVYTAIVDPSDSTKYILADNKTFNDIHTQYSSGKKQINVKYTDQSSATRIYTLSHIDSGGAMFNSVYGQQNNSTIYYLYVPAGLSRLYVQFGNSVIENGVGIDNITITYASDANGTTPPADNQGSTINWYITVPTVTPGNYLWTKIEITTTDNDTTTAYSVARQGVDGSGGGSSSAMTIETSLSGAAQPNVLYNLGTLSGATSITLGGTLSQNTAAEYLFRFKTGASSNQIVTFTHPTYTILYPYDYILNLNTEYEVSILWDGSKLLVRNCAYTNS